MKIIEKLDLCSLKGGALHIMGFDRKMDDGCAKWMNTNILLKI